MNIAPVNMANYNANFNGNKKVEYHNCGEDCYCTTKDVPAMKTELIRDEYGIPIDAKQVPAEEPKVDDAVKYWNA